MRTQGSAEELERRRRLAIDRLQEGYTQQAVADFLDVNVRSVRMWWRQFRQHGSNGLNAKPHPGRPRKLNRRQEGFVLRWLRKSPKSFGFATDLWTAPRLAQVIERKFDIEFHPRYLNQWLAQRRITPQKPQRKARERNDEEIGRWKEHDWPRIQNERAANGPTLSSSMNAAC
jgi:transposase